MIDILILFELPYEDSQEKLQTHVIVETISKVQRNYNLTLSKLNSGTKLTNNSRRNGALKSHKQIIRRPLLVF